MIWRLACKMVVYGALLNPRNSLQNLRLGHWGGIKSKILILTGRFCSFWSQYILTNSEFSLNKIRKRSVFDKKKSILFVTSIHQFIFTNPRICYCYDAAKCILMPHQDLEKVGWFQSRKNNQQKIKAWLAMRCPFSSLRSASPLSRVFSWQ